jgi:hypothetical protein
MTLKPDIEKGTTTKKTLFIENIQPRPYTWQGTRFEPRTEHRTIYNAVIVPGKSIRIWGFYGNVVGKPRPFDLTFKIGDWAEYDSYNLTYCGHITKIGPKTVTILHEYSTITVTRLDLYTFCFRNHDFDIERIREHNANWQD